MPAAGGGGGGREPQVKGGWKWQGFQGRMNVAGYKDGNHRQDILSFSLGLPQSSDVKGSQGQDVF